jgi:hypothetical protein
MVLFFPCLFGVKIPLLLGERFGQHIEIEALEFINAISIEWRLGTPTDPITIGSEGASRSPGSIRPLKASAVFSVHFEQWLSTHSSLRYGHPCQSMHEPTEVKGLPVQRRVMNCGPTSRVVFAERSRNGYTKARR